MKNYLEQKFKNKKVLILGFGREGQSTYKLLRSILPNQMLFIADESQIDYLTDANTQKNFGQNYLSDLQDFDVIVKSPGISALKPELISAREKGIEITSQTRIFFDLCKKTIIGITGTKGKSTTASLLFEILKNAKLKVSLVGNIGSPVLDSLEDGSDYYVFELSSHQLYDLDKSPQIAIVTNVGVDHLDWYGTFENYIDAKTHIVKYQTNNDTAILNYDNLITREFDRFKKGRLYFTSKDVSVNGAFVEGENIYLNTDGKKEFLGNTSELQLIGRHNWDNVMLASVAAKSLAVLNEIIWDTCKSFKQLEHHLEFVKEVKGIKFYNDSFAVDQIATMAAVDSFSTDITLILGGYERGIIYKELTDFLAGNLNLKTIVLVGQIADKLESSLKESGYKGKIIKLEKPAMEVVVKTAFENTQNGGIALLSPAAASFDMFRDYKDRGEQFKKSVLALTDKSP